MEVIIVLKLPKKTSVADLVREVVNAMKKLAEQDLTNKVYIIELGQVRLYSPDTHTDANFDI